MKQSLGDYILKFATKEKKNEPNYNKMTKRIFLGNKKAANDEQFFKKNNIKAVLNCTKDVPNYFHSNKTIEYMRIPVDDELRESDFESMYRFMPVIAEFIHKHSDIQKENIFIGCWAGRQRSMIAFTAYLIKFKGMTPYKACEYAIKKRPVAFHNGTSLNFEKSIMKYYNDISKK